MKKLIIPIEELEDYEISAIVDEACQHGVNRDTIELTDKMVTISDYPLPDNREDDKLHFRKQIAEELSYQELIDRLCEEHEQIVSLRHKHFEIALLLQE